MLSFEWRYYWKEVRERDALGETVVAAKSLGGPAGTGPHAQRRAPDQSTRCSRKQGRGAWVPLGLKEGGGRRALGRVLVFSDEIRKKVINRVRR